MKQRLFCFLSFAVLAFPQCRTRFDGQKWVHPAASPPRPPKPEPLRVLSYNICFECMTHNVDTTVMTGSAAHLGKICDYVTPQNLTKSTVCGQNIARFLQDTEETYGKLDFIALQEASRVATLQEENHSLLSDYAKVESKSGHEDMVTYYRKDRFHLEEELHSEFNPGRPWQILIFKEGLIFINAHFPHHKKDLASILNHEFEKKITENKVSTYQTYRIIMAADFNDAGNWYHKVHFAPNPLFQRILETSSTLPKTCCSPTFPYIKTDFDASFDYILDSVKGVKIEVPKNFHWYSPKSDHLPVIGILAPLVQSNIGG